ncbi:type I polyketide synthase [Chondromyces crocatus]|uniref:Uncharacterized protein n=1 Tax=Chondromyces crocatus TaxID=52 RepID=A0A0K1ERH0_CHOCO|nr:type I polyketide synthase [Chondromyces crocatus]AKT43247.1 uncharacterized protein CMC5_074780 [Chondromyces crocatus]
MSREPIAIIGMGCRFAQADGIDAYWRILTDGIDVVGPRPEERSEAGQGAWDGLPREGGFLQGIDRFDATFFQLSPREASQLDPQHRLLLEVCWETFEHAGVIPEALHDRRVGVFVGMASNDYEALQQRRGKLDPHAVRGGARSGASGCISRAFGLEGPSFTADAAGASSLLGVHLACQSLWAGEVSLALAAGANLVLLPEHSLGTLRAGLLSPEGRCKFADETADGYARSEGIGAVLLKPLSAAQRDGDPIHAVILGSAVDHDGGRGHGLHATPSQAAQESLLRAAYAHADVAPTSVRYIEACGAGASASDAVELGAIAAVLGQGRAADAPVYVGSVKSNLGHTEGCAGLAGLIKAALCLQHGTIPESLHVQQPTSQVAWEKVPVRVPVVSTPWPEHDGPARAGVSAFGLSGTKVHVVLEAAPAAAATAHAHASTESEASSQTKASTESEAGTTVGTEHLLTFSARSPEALQARVAAFHEWLRALEREDEERFRDVCATALYRRTHHEERFSLVARSAADARAQLGAYLAAERRVSVVRRKVLPVGARRAVFVCTGNGSQWAGMGRELLRTERVFRDALGACDEAMRRYLDVGSLLELIEADAKDPRLTRTDVIQAMIFALQVAVARWWHHTGVTPAAVVGHSMGEVPAAHIAGALDLDDAVRVVCESNKLLMRAAGKGGMLAVGLSPEQAQGLLRGLEDRVSVAVISAPTSIVLSGDRATLDALATELQQREVFCRALAVDVAFHSPHMAPLLDEYRVALEGLRPRSTSIPMLSSVHGAWIEGEDLGAAYWCRVLGEPVRFAGAMETLLSDGHEMFVEISPHPLMTGAIRQCGEALGRAPTALGSLQRNAGERASLLTTAGHLHAAGLSLDWSALTPPPSRVVSLPPYPWQRTRHWFEHDEARALVAQHASHPLEPSLTRERTERSSEQAATADPPAHLEPEIRAELLSAPLEERRARVEALLQKQLAHVLGVAPEAIDPTVRLSDKGLDSLMALELRKAIERDVGLLVPIARLLQGPSVVTLAGWVVEHLESPEHAASSAATPESDRTLDPDIQPPSGEASSTMRAVLLTGATGFLGPFLLRELLERTDATVHCLVRARDERGAAARLEQALRERDCWDEALWKRVVPVVGDLEAPRLGIADALYARLAGEIDAIVHNGAAVNFLYGYTELRASNVLGTREILLLATTQRLKRVHHVSTLAVFPMLGHTETIAEDEPLTRPAERSVSGYGESKRVAEQVMEIARARGIPVTIYRAGFVTGDSRTGYLNADDILSRFARACVDLGAVPALNRSVRVTPADYVSAALVQLARSPASVNRTYHLLNPEASAFDWVCDSVRARGYPLDEVSTDEWLRRALADARSRAESPAAPLRTVLALLSGALIDASRVVFDTRDAVHALADTGVRCPPIDVALIDRYVDFAVRTGVLPPPSSPARSVRVSKDTRPPQASTKSVATIV